MIQSIQQQGIDLLSRVAAFSEPPPSSQTTSKLKALDLNHDTGWLIVPYHQTMVPKTLAAVILLHLCCSLATLVTPSSANEAVPLEGALLSEIDHHPLALADVDSPQGCQPRHVHLSVGRTQNATHSSMTVSFSIAPICVVEEGFMKTVGAVRVGEEHIIVEADPNNDVKSYNTSRSDHNHYFSDLYYHIEINNLQPDREYSYECLLLKKEELSAQQYLRQDRSSEVINKDDDDERIISRSGVSTFHTPPAPGQWPSDTIKFAVLGDLATKPHSRETVGHLDNEQDVDCILLAGDLSYANNHHRIWDEW